MRTATQEKLGFSYFEFKTRLIRVDFSLQNTKIPVFELTTDSKEPTVSRRHRKAFSNLQTCLTASSWIHLILRIQLI